MKQKKFNHFSKQERMEISILKSKGYSIRNIAQVLGRDPGSISREIQRNRKKMKNKSLGPYDPKLAHRKAKIRRRFSKYQGKKIWKNDELKKYIEQKMKRSWSPEIISGRMRLENQAFYASKTTIYSFLYSSYGQYLCRYLFSKKYRKRKIRKNKIKRVLIPNRKGIEKRPKSVDLRLNYGHWETDTIVSGRKTGSKACLVVILERKARYVDIRKIDSLKPDLNNQAIKEMLKNLEIKTLTMDNGIENVKHKELSMNCFFCNPYSSWEKGGVENINKLIRRWISKGTDISFYSEEYLRNICSFLNNLPRKSLGYKTPLEVMRKNKMFKQNKTSKNVLYQRLNMIQLNELKALKNNIVSVAIGG